MWGRPLAQCCLGLCWARGGGHAPSPPVSLSRPHGCNLGVVNTSGEFLNEKKSLFLFKLKDTETFLLLLEVYKT